MSICLGHRLPRCLLQRTLPFKLITWISRLPFLMGTAVIWQAKSLNGAERLLSPAWMPQAASRFSILTGTLSVSSSWVSSLLAVGLEHLLFWTGSTYQLSWVASSTTVELEIPTYSTINGGKSSISAIGKMELKITNMYNDTYNKYYIYSVCV